MQLTQGSCKRPVGGGEPTQRLASSYSCSLSRLSSRLTLSARTSMIWVGSAGVGWWWGRGCLVERLAPCLRLAWAAACVARCGVGAGGAADDAVALASVGTQHVGGELGSYNRAEPEGHRFQCVSASACIVSLGHPSLLTLCQRHR